MTSFILWERWLGQHDLKPSSSDYVKEWVSWGAGPRAGQAMILTAKARALQSGRLAVTLEDLEHVALPVLRHRIIVNFKAEAEGIDSDSVTRRLLKTTQFSTNGI